MTSTTQADWLEHVLTEPLGLQELGTYFCTSTKHVRPLVESLSGTEKVGRRFRIMVRHMPPAYWIQAGLLSPVDVEPDVHGHSRAPVITSATRQRCETTTWE